ncbi:hypothetical protein V7x_10450 [Crateriforma conspicua]|uniref:Uncharacterized protein n=1 Tax=Crateriforma conspicua TaxID=2527996 RepID=A0A5C6FVZ0_9PLAN|nr:hypothetical protein [Crateriforma conspicua]TWU65498.1 hypothetical protein V7x_10450 [Crateriforma conspicua]
MISLETEGFKGTEVFLGSRVIGDGVDDASLDEAVANGSKGEITMFLRLNPNKTAASAGEGKATVTEL